MLGNPVLQDTWTEQQNQADREALDPFSNGYVGGPGGSVDYEPDF